MDNYVQKEGIPGFPGCLEYTSIISHLTWEAGINKGNLAVDWLDLANA